MSTIQILWVDDEIDLLKPHVMFLEQKGYEVETVNNGSDALEVLEEKNFDIVFLDENMPGLNGLETLTKIKEKDTELPVVMITKSEEESIMEDAIGSHISDYLIKPVNPNQILLTLKKNLDIRRLVTEKTNLNYQQEFRQIGMDLGSVNSLEEWEDMYKRLVYWELELDKLDDDSMKEILAMQKREANDLFSQFVHNNYEDWIVNEEKGKVFSHQAFNQFVGPSLRNKEKVFLIVIDNLRWDQWKVIQKEINSWYRTDVEETYTAMLPTATQYARNAFFAGLLPTDIKKKFGDKWVGEQDDDGKNLHEDFFLKEQLKRLGLGELKINYTKVTQHQFGKKYAEKLSNLMSNDLNVLVYNFVDMLSHSKTEMEVIRELAEGEKAYRSLTLSWFKNSPLSEVIRQLASKDYKVMITTDHGTVNVSSPSKVIGEKNLNTNLRYKLGRNISYNKKEVFEITNPQAVGLPTSSFTDVAIFAKEDTFFAYPNNYNHYVKYYRDTYQHGGVSLEEMIIPFVTLTKK